MHARRRRPQRLLWSPDRRISLDSHGQQSSRCATSVSEGEQTEPCRFRAYGDQLVEPRNASADQPVRRDLTFTGHDCQRHGLGWWPPAPLRFRSAKLPKCSPCKCSSDSGHPYRPSSGALLIAAAPASSRSGVNFRVSFGRSSVGHVQEQEEPDGEAPGADRWGGCVHEWLGCRHDLDISVVSPLPG